MQSKLAGMLETGIVRYVQPADLVNGEDSIINPQSDSLKR